MKASRSILLPFGTTPFSSLNCDFTFPVFSLESQAISHNSTKIFVITLTYHFPSQLHNRSETMKIEKKFSHFSRKNTWLWLSNIFNVIMPLMK